MTLPLPGHITLDPQSPDMMAISETYNVSISIKPVRPVIRVLHLYMYMYIYLFYLFFIHKFYCFMYMYIINFTSFATCTYTCITMYMYIHVYGIVHTCIHNCKLLYTIGFIIYNLSIYF